MTSLRVIAGPRPLRGEIELPGDKSVAHRALIFAGLAEGGARLRGLPEGGDVRRSLRAMRALGLEVEGRQGEWRVQGKGGRLREPDAVLDCGNSGTTLRLLCGLLAGQDLFAVLTGDASLRRRPMRRVAEPLRQMGAAIEGRAGASLPPLAIRGRADLRGLRWSNPSSSAQVRSALWLAGLQARDAVEIHDPLPSRDHGERLLRAMGALLQDLPAPQGRAWRLEPGPLRCVDLDVPGDLSSAAFWLVGASLVPGSSLRLRGVGLNPGRMGLLQALRAMGGKLRIQQVPGDGPEPRGDIEVEATELRGVALDPRAVPTMIDELPIFALAAAFARGPSVVRGAGELRVKESDRIAGTVALIRALGGRAEELADGFRIEGSGGEPLAGGRVQALGDHRLAMTAAIAALRCRAPVEIQQAQGISTSYPTFLHDLEALRA